VVAQVIELVKRLLLSGVLVVFIGQGRSVLLPGTQPLLRLVFATFFSVVFLGVQLVVKPYKRSDECVAYSRSLDLWFALSLSSGCWLIRC
jgi:hypothetical protein